MRRTIWKTEKLRSYGPVSWDVALLSLSAREADHILRKSPAYDDYQRRVEQRRLKSGSENMGQSEVHLRRVSLVALCSLRTGAHTWLSHASSMAVRCSANFSGKVQLHGQASGTWWRIQTLTNQWHQNQAHKHVADLSFTHNIVNLLDWTRRQVDA